MSFLDIFRIKKLKSELNGLRKDNDILSSLMKPEHQEIADLIRKLNLLKEEEARTISTINSLNEDYAKQSLAIQSQISTLKYQHNIKQKELLVLDEQIMLESFALYEPKFNFTNSSTFKQQLDTLRERQKAMIKSGTACTGSTNWTVNNNKTEGKRMVNDMIKLTLRSFNNECDSCVENVKFNNIQTHERRINASLEALNKLGKIMSVSISSEYKRLKIQELYLAYEYQLKKQEEKEEQRQIREQMREEARLQREIDDARKTVEKEKRHYSNAVNKLTKQLETCTNEDERELLINKLNELSDILGEIEIQLKDIDYREANQRAGYVYIISNIGSFGEGVFKIGMTRRLDPYDRVYELGDASVPFNFDVHAMIFSNDAPKLESALHREFETKRLNTINKRREYFNVTIDEIETMIKRNHDQTVEFIKTAAAEEFRESQLLNNQNAGSKEVHTALEQAAASRQ
ncbi:DUF4041 domain-containing protein [Paenibacillus sp. strain BS8-2]